MFFCLPFNGCDTITGFSCPYLGYKGAGTSADCGTPINYGPIDKMIIFVSFVFEKITMKPTLILLFTRHYTCVSTCVRKYHLCICGVLHFSLHGKWSNGKILFKRHVLRPLNIKMFYNIIMYKQYCYPKLDYKNFQSLEDTGKLVLQFLD